MKQQFLTPRAGRQVLPGDYLQGRIKALHSQVMAYHEGIARAAAHFKATGQKPGKLKIGALKHGR